ncbi:hypothetical protein [Sorangium sp. So ce1000]|uniref:hypothetical protein n=1 Tax=Sorangium sp. So ce1000 TaxID=3133325 RepID=UPI003F5EF429
MTYIASLGGRTALAAAVMSGAALIIGCAGTLADKEQYLTGGDDGSGSGSGQGNGAAAGGGSDPTTTGGGSDPTTTGGGSDPTTTGGGSDPTTTGGGDVGCAEAQALVMQKCAFGGCHDSGSKQAGVDLSTGWETRVAGQASTCGGTSTVLVPGDPDASLIYRKIMPNPPCGSQMPLGPALSDEEITCLHDYIAALPK